MSIQQLPRLVTRSSFVLAPLLALASPLAAASLKTGAAAELATITHHPDRYYAFTLLQLLATALFVPAFVGLMQLARGRAPFPAIVGGGLLLVGALVGIADCGTQLVYWQTGAPGTDPAQMVALFHRFESAAGANAFFMVGGISLITGSLLLGTALWRAGVAPAWTALCLPLGLVGHIVAFAAGSRLLLAVASLVLLVGLGRIAAARDTTPAKAAEPAVVGAR